jgi:hypothetical protein
MHKTRYKTIHARIKQLKTPIKHTDKSIKRKTRIKPIPKRTHKRTHKTNGIKHTRKTGKTHA